MNRLDKGIIWANILQWGWNKTVQYVQISSTALDASPQGFKELYTFEAIE